MTSPEPQSVTLLLQLLKDGDQDASSEIWRRYITQLLPLARRKLRGIQSRMLDEEDVLLSVFDRFFQAARDERFSRLHNRDDLWQILLVLTERRVVDQFRAQHAQKRGGGNVGSLEATSTQRELPQDHLQELADSQPTPEFAATFADQLETALNKLEQPSTREVAVLRMEGFAVQEIADRLEISISSVERKLRTIRSVWEHMNA